MENMISSGNGNSSVAFYSAEKDIALKLLCNAGDTQSVQIKFRENLELQQFNSASGEGLLRDVP